MMRGLQTIRQWAAWALDRAAFAAETISVAFALFVVLTLAVTGFQPFLAAHEWALFLTHYVDAPKPAREPVDLALIVFALALNLFAASARLGPARSVWRARRLGVLS